MGGETCSDRTSAKTQNICDNNGHDYPIDDVSALTLSNSSTNSRRTENGTSNREIGGAQNSAFLKSNLQ